MTKHIFGTSQEQVDAYMQGRREAFKEAAEEVEKLKRDQNTPKKDDPHFTGCGGCGEQYPAICGCREVNQALTDAQNVLLGKE